jgi:putative chitinase
MITAQQLVTITGKPLAQLTPFVDGINKTFDKYLINTPLRQCHFLSQVLHESGCFKYMKEIADGKLYEGRKDLGNIQPGDGPRFKGRGLIQITGRNNYNSIKISLGIDCISKPELLEQLPYAVMSAGWYWSSRHLNIFADADDVIKVTKLINGGTNGLEDRKAWLVKCKGVIK